MVHDLILMNLKCGQADSNVTTTLSTFKDAKSIQNPRANQPH